MKLLAFFALSLGILGCMAQSSSISLPKSGSTIVSGQPLLVQVERPDSIEGSTEVGMVIAILQCLETPCPSPTSELGNIVFNGQFNPQFHTGADEPYENFTVTVPSFETGSGTSAQLATARFYVIGAGNSPVLETNTVSLNIYL